MNETIHRNALPQGYQLHWYDIESVLGQGGFGITYLAMDKNLSRQVAIKEYLPSDLAVREDDSTLHPITSDRKESFEWGLGRFINEAKTLAKFNHPNIVRVYNVFEANNTAYMVMEFEQGDSLAALLDSGCFKSQGELLKILFPLLDGIEHMHKNGFIHRDIKPANIYVRENGSPVLLDFGSARMALGTRASNLTSYVSPCFAPYEQYGETSELQGGWSDIYGLGATLYYAIAGYGPVDALSRGTAQFDRKPDPLKSAREIGAGRYTPAFLKAIDKALKFRPDQRPQSIAHWRAMFEPIDAPPGSNDETELAVDAFKQHPTRPLLSPAELSRDEKSDAEATNRRSDNQAVHSSPRKYRRSLLFASLAAAIALVAIAGSVLFFSKEQPADEPVAWSDSVRVARLTGPVDSLLTRPSKAPERETVSRTPKLEKPSAAPSVQKIEPLTVAPEKKQNEVKQDAVTELTNVLEEKNEPKLIAAEPADTVEIKDEPELIAAELADAVEKKDEPELIEAPVSDAGSEISEQVQQLLASAEDAIRDNRLTSPENDNALAYFQAVRALEPDNQTASEGNRRIAQQYVVLADTALDNRRISRARRYLNKAETVAPGEQIIVAARGRLKQRNLESLLPKEKPPVAVLAPPPAQVAKISPQYESVGATANAEVSTESKPTILIVLQEKVMGIFGTTGWEVPTQAELTVMQKFRGLGFPVVDSRTVRRNVTQAKGLRMLEADNRSAAAIGLQHNAQISIVGTAISKFAGAKLYGTQMQSIQATVTARAIQNDTGRVIATASAIASQAHIDELQGGVLALKKAATELAEKLAPQVVASVGAGAGEPRMISLKINGLKSYRHLDFILYFFEEKVNGISEVYLRDFTNSVADVNIRYDKQTAVLARKVAKKKFRGFRLEPMNVTDNRIDLAVVGER